MFSKPATLLAALALGGVGCARKPAAVERMAVLRFENLSGDPAYDWAGRVFSDSILSQLTGARNVSPITTSLIGQYNRALGVQTAGAPGVSAERTQALLAGATRIGYGHYTIRSGRMEARLTLEDPARQRVVKTFAASGAPADVLGLATALARQAAGGTTPYGTSNREAARAWAAALETAAPEAAETALALSLAADPAFVPPRLMLAQLKLARQDRAGALAVLGEDVERMGEAPPADRARLQLENALLRGDREGRRQALEALTRAAPNDVAAWSASAEAASARHDYRGAADALRKALALEPRNGSFLNGLAYAAASAGDLQGALEALDRYAALRPAEANPLDSRGDVHLHLGRFREAERHYLEAHAKDAAFLGGGSLFKAAMARLMTGDTAAADALAKRHIEARQAAKDPTVEYRKAEWSWASGRRKEGFERLAAFAAAHQTGALRELAARASAQLAIWSLALGDREKAIPLAAQANSLAGSSTAPVASLARFLTLPPASASEWAVRAERAYPEAEQTQFKHFARLYALLLAGEHAAAAPLLRQVYDSGGAADPTLPVLLAWSYLETGKTAEAAQLLAFTPIPSADGFTPASVMSFPRLFYLRGLLAEKQGRRDAARAEYRTFLQLSGPTPLAWGEEKRAAARLD